MVCCVVYVLVTWHYMYHGHTSKYQPVSCCDVQRNVVCSAESVGVVVSSVCVVSVCVGVWVLVK